jgi:hypothetical protein
MNKPYDPTHALMGTLAGKASQRALMIRHNKRVLARGMTEMKLKAEPKT